MKNPFQRFRDIINVYNDEKLKEMYDGRQYLRKMGECRVYDKHDEESDLTSAGNMFLRLGDALKTYSSNWESNKALKRLEELKAGE